VTAFKSLTLAGVKGFVRDKATLFFSIVFPLMFLVVFGLIFASSSTSKIKIGVVGDGPVVQALNSTGAVDLQHYNSIDEGVQHVKDGDVPAVVAETGGTVTLRFAASDQTQAGTVQGLVSGVTDKVNLAATHQKPLVNLDSSQVEDASLKPIQYLTPGIMSWSVATSAVFGAALTLVSWRRKQVLRRLRLAPINPVVVLTSRLTVAVTLAVVQAALFVGIAATPAFGLKLSGTWYLAIPVFLLGILAFFSIGMLVGSFAKTEEAGTAAANIVVLPMAFLSGTFFPLDSAPPWLRAVSNVFPLRHMNDGLTDFLVRGKAASALLLPCSVLIGFILVVSFVASRVFRWEDA
jgi:ABC-2 type transport system permease protein